MLTFFKDSFLSGGIIKLLAQELKQFFMVKYVGMDNFGNKYYQSKSDKRWVIYNGEIDASKIPNEWYLWMHYIK